MYHMKRLLAAFMLVFAFVLAGCGEQDGEEPDMDNGNDIETEINGDDINGEPEVEVEGDAEGDG